MNFIELLAPSKIQQTDLLEEHDLRLDKVDIPFYLVNQTKNSVTVFMEKGLFTLGDDRLDGNPWAVINCDDTPEEIQTKLYDDRKRFGVAMQKKLWKICEW